jgi:RNA 3'-terminal phosphate cyclase (ATP)
VITIDGSYGEGGGQILRTALSLSAISGQPICIDHVRAGRRQPGLRPQHVTAVRAVAALCGARLEGDAVGSRRLLFEPRHRPQPGRYDFDVRSAASSGSAGSVTLVLQTILLPLSLAAGDSDIILHGGTHVAWSPPVHYMQRVYLPALQRLGLHARVDLLRWGWYPHGGGEVRASVTGSWLAEQAHGGNALLGPGIATDARAKGPCECPEILLQPPASNFQLTGRRELVRVSGLSATSRLPDHVARRMRRRAQEHLHAAGVAAEIELVDAPSPGSGAGLFLFAEYACPEGEPVVCGFSGYGRQGKPAEAVAGETVTALLAHHESGAPVDPHLADQLILPLVLSGRTAAFRTSAITMHLQTVVCVVRQFLDARMALVGELGQAGTVNLAVA